MTIEQDLELLASDRPHERLKAARRLSRAASPELEEPLKQALRREGVGWVRSALAHALEKLHERDATRTGIAAAEDDTEDFDQLRRQVESKVVREVTSTLAHEFAAIIATAKLYAVDEIPEYPESRTRRQLDRLSALLDAIATLRDAARPPANQSIELSMFISDLLADEPNLEGILVQQLGPTPCLVQADPRLLTLAFLNGLRNARDALTDNPAGSRSEVIIDWAATDTESWIAIIDDGSGLSTDAEKAFAIGTTRKEGHLGMGLPIARQAMKSMDGDVELTPTSTGGTRYYMHWPHTA